MPDNGKVTLSEAAKTVGVHYNTLRNWRKAGWLKSAEKVIQSGNETWIVSLSEVENIARQRSMTNDYTSPQAANTTNPTFDTPNPDNGPLRASQDEQALAPILEKALQHLNDALERRDTDFKQLQEENQKLHQKIGQLEERLRLLEAPQPPPPAAPIVNDSQETPRKRRWWQL